MVSDARLDNDALRRHDRSTSLLEIICVVAVRIATLIAKGAAAQDQVLDKTQREA
jgi:hypothetical protein